MIYKNVVKGKFISRPNRFIAVAEIGGEEYRCHVKNTGRCRELLVDGAEIFLEESDNPDRRTRYSLIAVKKGGRLINMDSQAPNKAVGEWLEKGGFPGGELSLIQAERTYGKSRFDYYIESGGRKIFLEVKGVTLEENGVVMFPDAPTERGVKHIYELCRCMDEGYEAWLLLVVQMKGVRYFTPNDKTHPQFGEALRYAEKRGVNILAVDCEVTENSMEISEKVEVRL